MFKRVIAVIVIVAMSNLMLSGCTKAVRVQPDKVATDRCKVSSIDLVTGEHIDFDQHGGVYNPVTKTIRGFDKKGKAVIINFSEVREAQIRKSDRTSNAILIALSIGMVAFFVTEIIYSRIEIRVW